MFRSILRSESNKFRTELLNSYFPSITLLVLGPSGSGKSSLIQTFTIALNNDASYFKEKKI